MLKKKYIYLCFLYLVFSVFSLQGQYMNGLINSNHAGINALEFNPSANGNHKEWMNIRVFGGHFFLTTNFAYLPGVYSVFQFIPNADGENVGKQAFNEVSSLINKVDLMYGDKKEGIRNKNFFNLLGQIFVRGPGFSLTQGRNNYGFSLANYKQIYDYRYIDFLGISLLVDKNNLINIANLPNAAALNALDEDYQDLIRRRYKGLKGAVFTYVEFPITYSRSFTYGNNFFSLGGTLKPLVTYKYEEYFVGKKPALDEDAVGTDWSTVLPSISYFKSDGEEGGFFNNSGVGIAFDLGFTWYKMEDQATFYYPHFKKEGFTNNRRYRGITMDYKFKMGFAFTDIGFASVNGFETSLDGNEFASFLRLGLSTKQILDRLLEPSTRTVIMPTAFRFNFDYHIHPKWYLGAVYTQHLHRVHGVGSPDLLGFIPRYETPAFEFAFPVSLLDWQVFQIGWMARIYWFTLGMDDIASLVNPLGMRNLDFYLQVNVPIHSHPAIKDFNDKRNWRDGYKYKNNYR